MSCEFSIMSLASEGFAPRPPPGLRPWTPLGDFRPPDPLFRIPFMKILDPPLHLAHVSNCSTTVCGKLLLSTITRTDFNLYTLYKCILTSTNILWIRNCQTCCRCFFYEITRWQHFSARNDVMAAILKCDVKSKSDSVNRCVFTQRTFLPNFIPI